MRRKYWEIFLCHILFELSSNSRQKIYGCLESKSLLIFSTVRSFIPHTTQRYPYPIPSIPTYCTQCPVLHPSKMVFTLSCLSLCNYAQIFRLVTLGPGQTIMAFLQADQSNLFHVLSPIMGTTPCGRWGNIVCRCFGFRIMFFRCLDTVGKSVEFKLMLV